MTEKVCSEQSCASPWNELTKVNIVELAAMANSKARQEFPTKTHKESGYSWSRAEDEPGYTWMNKKAHDEYGRAWDSMVHKDHMVRSEC
jgi:hypothetical protein